MTLLQSIIDATTTPTSLNHDEYELPRDIRTVRINRLKAGRAMGCSDVAAKRKHSVFSQLRSEVRGWNTNTFRRGYVAKGHGGQKRAFKVKLIGEGVNDYSGPYREIFTDAMREIAECEALSVLESSANKKSGIGEDRSLQVFHSQAALDLIDSAQENRSIVTHYRSKDEMILRQYYSSFLVPRNDAVREVEESISFLGRIVALSLRHGIPSDLALPSGLVWSRLCEEKVDMNKALEEVDAMAGLHINEGTSWPSNFFNVQKRLLNCFADGMSVVAPIEIFAFFDKSQLRNLFCGNSDINVELLQKIVEYEGYNENDETINMFWNVLREMTSDDRKSFLQFVWARSRLPLRESDFEAPFKILKKNRSEELPSASTCFFSLSLPDYRNEEILRKKLMFAINNVTTMESDYNTNVEEVMEGWNGL